MLLQPLVFFLQLPKAALVVPYALASRGRLLYRGGLTAPTIPTAGQALERWQPHTAAEPATLRTSEPSYSSPRGLPLPCLPWLRVVPFLGLAVVHRPGVVGAAWSRNNFHRTWTVCGEADSWVHDRSKEVPPYFTENNDSSTQ